MPYRHDTTSCNCVACDDVRKRVVRVGSLVKSIVGGTTTWDKKRFVWDSARLPENVHFLVIRELQRDEPGGHLDSVEILTPYGLTYYTSKKWLITVEP